jgi:uroporphyrinogen-III synthase
MRPILVLRPEPGASETIGRAREAGLDAFALPLFDIEPLKWTVPEASRFDALLLTSANALRHGGEQLQLLRGLPVYTIGEATAHAARERGFDIAAVGEAGLDRLLGSIETDLRLLHLCGEDRTAPDGPSQDITAIPVYRAREVEEPDLSKARGCVALVHSSRAGKRFSELVTGRDMISIAAISTAAAEAAGGGWEAIESTDQPTDDALLALAASLCNKPPTK